jgi:hypothetical protein
LKKLFSKKPVLCDVDWERTFLAKKCNKWQRRRLKIDYQVKRKNFWGQAKYKMKHGSLSQIK